MRRERTDLRRAAGAAVMAAAAGLGAAACGGGPASGTEAPGPRAIPVHTAAVATRTLDEEVTFTGTLRPRAQVQVVAEVGARLVRIVKDEGARVGAGEVLAVLDATDYRLAHDRARAGLQVAEANRAHAAAEAERAQNLLQTGGITDKDRLAAQVNLQVAEAALAQARAEAAISGQQQARTEIRAPFAGRVAQRHADAGAMLAANTPVFTLVDDSRYELRAAVPAARYGALEVGARVQVTVDSRQGSPLPGRIARIAPLVDERNRAFEVTVEVAAAPGLVGGLFARASVGVGQALEALVVPPSALVRDGAAPRRAALFVLKDGRAQRREVELGAERTDAVQVTSGVVAGEEVVVDPPAALADGAPVQRQAARATAAAPPQSAATAGPAGPAR